MEVIVKAKKYSEKITLFKLSNQESLSLMCKALVEGAIIRLRSKDLSIKMVQWKDNSFVLINEKQVWEDKEFLQQAYESVVHLRREDLIPEMQIYSDTEVARKLGDNSLALTMSEMHENGEDVWGS
jgi:hypothetical protein